MQDSYLVKVTVSHQLILVLQCVLEKCPYDGLQFRVRGQQAGAEYPQPRIGQAVHYRGEIKEKVGHHFHIYKVEVAVSRFCLSAHIYSTAFIQRARSSECSVGNIT